MDDGGDWVAAIERICAWPEGRRELLWVRAMSKGDEADARSLLELDPEIPARVRRVHDLRHIAELPPHERREAYERLHDAHFDHLAEASRAYVAHSGSMR
ncbi:MAG: hypothetical protein AB7S26_12005 [Sandaracinaceae bacterium]